MKSIKELKQLVATHSPDQLRAVVASNPDLAKQLSFSVPHRTLTSPKDLIKLDQGKQCCCFGTDPETGKLICLKWEPCDEHGPTGVKIK